MVYYKSRLAANSNVNHLLYFILSAFGMLISIGAILHSLIFTFSLTNKKAALSVLLPVSYILMITSTYSSALLSAMLAVVRTINITHPVRRISRLVIMVCLSVYWVIWLVIASADSYFWASEASNGSIQLQYYFSFINMSGLTGLINLLYKNGLLADFFIRNNTTLFPILIWVIPCVIPSMVCLVCTVAQISLLWKKRVSSSGNSVHSKVTITIILLTAVFFLCNTTSFTVCMMMVYQQWKAGKKLWLALYFVTSMTASINALSNPVILITRGQQLRKYVLALVPGIREDTKGRETT